MSINSVLYQNQTFKPSQNHQTPPLKHLNRQNQHQTTRKQDQINKNNKIQKPTLNKKYKNHQLQQISILYQHQTLPSQLRPKNYQNPKPNSENPVRNNQKQDQNTKIQKTQNPRQGNSRKLPIFAKFPSHTNHKHHDADPNTKLPKTLKLENTKISKFHSQPSENTSNYKTHQTTQITTNKQNSRKSANPPKSRSYTNPKHQGLDQNHHKP